MVCLTCARPQPECLCAGTFAGRFAESVPVPGGTRAAVDRLAAAGRRTVEEDPDA